MTCLGNQGCKTLSPTSIAALVWDKAYTKGLMSKDAMVTFVAICLAESGGAANNRGGPNDNGSYDYGLWQINWWPGDKGPPGWNEPFGNLVMALAKYKTQGFNAWCSWKSTACGGNGNGSYADHLDEARNAVNDVLGQPESAKKLVKAVGAQDWDLDAAYSTGLSGAAVTGANVVSALNPANWIGAVTDFVKRWFPAIMGGALILLAVVMLFKSSMLSQAKAIVGA